MFSRSRTKIAVAIQRTKIAVAIFVRRKLGTFKNECMMGRARYHRVFCPVITGYQKKTKKKRQLYYVANS